MAVNAKTHARHSLRYLAEYDAHAAPYIAFFFLSVLSHVTALKKARVRLKQAINRDQPETGDTNMPARTSGVKVKCQMSIFVSHPLAALEMCFPDYPQQLQGDGATRCSCAHCTWGVKNKR